MEAEHLTYPRDDAGAALMLAIAPLSGVLILGHSLTSMVLYVWARRNQHVRMSLFHLFNFNAPYFPWVMLGLSVLLGSSPMRDLLGIGAGHIYFYFEDVLPRITGGRRYLRAPRLVKRLFGEDEPPVGVVQPQGGTELAQGPVPPAPVGGGGMPAPDGGHAHIE
jgi:Derlin-2/3